MIQKGVIYLGTPPPPPPQVLVPETTTILGIYSLALSVTAFFLLPPPPPPHPHPHPTALSLSQASGSPPPPPPIAPLSGLSEPVLPGSTSGHQAQAA